MKAKQIKIESAEQARELIRQEVVRMNEYFAEFDETLQRVLKRISGFLEDAPSFTMEEMVLESYCCFVRMLKLAVMVDSYKGYTNLMFINGREEMESLLKEKMANISNKILETVDDWVAANVRVNEKGSMSISTAIVDAIDRASIAEKIRMMDHNERMESMDTNTRFQQNLVAMERLVSLGALPNDVKNQSFEELLKSELASNMIGGLLGDETEKNYLVENHLGLLSHAPVYTSLIIYLFNYICIKLYETGWEKFTFVKDEVLQKRLSSQKIIFWQTNDYRQRLDDLLAEDLLDEGEPTAQKIKEFKKKFISEHKTDLIVKRSKLCAGDEVRFAHELIENKVSLESLQDFFFYEGVMIEIDKRTVPEDDKNEMAELLSNILSTKGVAIFADKIVQHENYGDNYNMQPGSKIIKEDNNG